MCPVDSNKRNCLLACDIVATRSKVFHPESYLPCRRAPWAPAPIDAECIPGAWTFLNVILLLQRDIPYSLKTAYILNQFTASYARRVYVARDSLQCFLNLIQRQHDLNDLLLNSLVGLFIRSSRPQHGLQITLNASHFGTELTCSIFCGCDASLGGVFGMSRHPLQRQRLVVLAHLPQVKDL